MSFSLSLGSTVELYDTDQVAKALDKATGQNEEGLRRVYRKMLDAGPSRFVSKPSNSGALEQVREVCPNFSGVLDDLSNYIELSLVGKGGLNILPILLAGDPGVGKTHFAKTLAKALSLPYQFVSMGTLTAGWVLSGSAPTWSGARHGKVAEALIDNEFANPVYLVDELDKTGGDNRYDPFGALLQLLEKETALHFKDEYLDIPMNASCILWVGTANNVDLIPDYIQSRMAVYEVPVPTSEQSRTIAANIYASLLKDNDWPFEPTLRESAQEVLVQVPPREMKKKLLDGMAHAVRSRRHWLEPYDIRSSKSRGARTMGFSA